MATDTSTILAVVILSTCPGPLLLRSRESTQHSHSTKKDSCAKFICGCHQLDSTYLRMTWSYSELLSFMRNKGIQWLCARPALLLTLEKLTQSQRWHYNRSPYICQWASPMSFAKSDYALRLLAQDVPLCYWSSPMLNVHSSYYTILPYPIMQSLTCTTRLLAFWVYALVM